MNALLIFAKAPVKGGVKTRLKHGTTLDNDEILGLYKAFLMDTIITSEETISDRIYLSCYPKERIADMKALLDTCFLGEIPEKYRVVAQEGRDFDERFTKTVERVLEENKGVVVIGSDSPHIKPGTIDKAHKVLDKRGGMIVGPTSEGGVYLVGIKRPFDFTNIFTKGIELDNLVNLAEEHGLPLFVLEELTDLDVSTDLITFICNIKAMEYAAKFDGYQPPKNTINAINDLGLRVESISGGERDRKLVRK